MNEQLKVLVAAELKKSMSETNINAQLKQLKIDSLKLNVDINKNNGQFQSQMKQAIVNAQKTIDTTPLKVKIANIDTSLNLDKIKLDSNLTSWLNGNQKAAKLFSSEIDRIRRSIDEADKAQLGQLRKQFQNVQAQAKALGVTGRTLFGELKNSASKFASWFFIGGGVTSVVRSFRQIYTNVVELDTAMVELRKVTEATDTQFIQFLDRAKDKSVALGSSLTDLVKATSNFSRLGYSLGDAEMLGQTATVYANVGDDIKNIDDATKSIISTMKAYNVTADDSILIADRYNEIGNKFAISSGGIGEGMRNASAALATAGNSIDQSIALIVAANNVIQNPAEVGTMWKTVSMRIRGVKTELEQAGLETEFMAESTSKLRDTILGITNVNGQGGFDILTDTGAFKSTYDIILGISKIWDEIGKKDPTGQAGLLELLAGKRQGNALSAALTNSKDMENAFATSLGSAGSAMKEHAVWLDSVEAKQQQLTAQFQAFSATVLDSGLIKGTFDAGTGILKFFTDLIDTMGAVPALAATVAGALSFKNVGELNTPTYVKAA